MLPAEPRSLFDLITQELKVVESPDLLYAFPLTHVVATIKGQSERKQRRLIRLIKSVR